MGWCLTIKGRPIKDPMNDCDLSLQGLNKKVSIFESLTYETYDLLQAL